MLVSRGIGPVTIKGYSGSIKRILVRLQTIRPTHRKLRRLVAELYRKNYSYSHIVNTMLAIERYMEFQHRKITFGRPRKPKPIIKNTLSEAEVTMILAFTKNAREKAILATLAYSGIRNKELCSLKVKDVDTAGNCVRVLAGKGKKDGVVCISPECSRILSIYLDKFKRNPDDYLFTTLRHNHQYQTGDTRKLLRVVAKRAGITKRVYPHLLRHSLATNLLNRGANIFTVQQQLRHSFIDTTMIYLKSTVSRMQSEYQFYAPSYA